MEGCDEAGDAQRGGYTLALMTVGWLVRGGVDEVGGEHTDIIFIDCFIF